MRISMYIYIYVEGAVYYMLNMKTMNIYELHRRHAAHFCVCFSIYLFLFFFWFSVQFLLFSLKFRW